MKTRNLLISNIICLGLTLGLSSCGWFMSPVQTHTDEYSGSAFIYSPKDSIYYRSYDIYPNGQRKLEEVLHPSQQYGNRVEWNSLSLSDTLKNERDKELHYLHIKKLTNQGLAYVIEGYGIHINNQRYIYIQWEAQGDSTTYTNPATGITEDIPVQALPTPPYSLQQVIDTLLEYYPQYVKVIDDTEEYLIGDYELVKVENEPHIYINLENHITEE